MASVSSLDADMRKLRLDRYTPQAAGEVREWIEHTLDEPLPAGDLLEALKDGVALCKLANLILPSPGIRFKKSDMPFTQRENIAHFLTACERQPLNMPSHDRFLTVDLYDGKDPAQVLQCIQAFSRAANAINPSRFSQVLGPPKRAASPVKRGTNGMSAYETSGFTSGRPTTPSRSAGPVDSTSSKSPNATRALSPTLSGSSDLSRSGTTTSGISSWSKRSDEGLTAPAWNIAQYGYMGGASQGNQGISFGARRQIIAPGAVVPSREEKERHRREREAEEERLQAEADQQRRAQIDAEEKQARLEEERRWEDETRRAHEQEKAALDSERRRWEEQEQKWRQEEEQRQKAEQSASNERTALNGQYLSQYQTGARAPRSPASRRESEAGRIKELERQLEEAKERERHYLEERGERGATSVSSEAAGAREQQLQKQKIQAERAAGREENHNVAEEQEFLQQQRAAEQAKTAPRPSTKADGNLPVFQEAPAAAPATAPEPISAPAPRPQPHPSLTPQKAAPSQSRTTFARASPGLSNTSKPTAPAESAAPPFSSASSASTTATPPSANRTDRFLASNAPPERAKPRLNFAPEMSTTSTNEREAEDRRRIESQQKTKAGGWAGKSLLEREMERERERQREWEEQQIKKGRLTGPRAMNPKRDA